MSHLFLTLNLAARFAGVLALTVVTHAQVMTREVATLEATIRPNDLDSGARFGISMDMDGDLLVIGADHRVNLPGHGSAYVYARSGTDWDQVAKLTAPVGSTNEFGHSVAISGDTAVVGAPMDDTTLTNAGKAYVFKRNAGVWELQATLEPPVPQTLGRFGVAVGIEDGVIAIGSSKNDVTIFTRSFNVWSFESTIVDPGPGFDGIFGFDISLEGDTLLVGEPFFLLTGTVHAYRRNGTSWNYEGMLLPAAASFGALAGYFVHLEEETAFVGLDVSDTLYRQGIVMFERTGTAWTETDTILGHDVSFEASPATSISREGDRIVVGVRDQGLTGDDFAGAAYVFERIGSRWLEVSSLRASSPESSELTGNAVILDGSSLLVGVPGSGPGVASGEVEVVSLAPGDFDTFCFGNGGDGMGCTPCPCANDFPTSLGGCRNSYNLSATLRAEGSASASGGGLDFFLTGGVESSFGVLTSGDNALPNAGPCAPLSSGIASPLMDSLRCVGGNLLRHGVRPLSSYGNQNPWLIDPSSFAVGSTRYFATIYRDLDDAVCQTGLSATNGVIVTVTP